MASIQWSPDLSLELQTQTPKCQLDLTSLTSTRHLKLHWSKTELLIVTPSQNFSFCCPPMSEHGDSILSFAKARNLRVTPDASIFTPHMIWQQILLSTWSQPPSSVFYYCSSFFGYLPSSAFIALKQYSILNPVTRQLGQIPSPPHVAQYQRKVFQWPTKSYRPLWSPFIPLPPPSPATLPLYGSYNTPGMLPPQDLCIYSSTCNALCQMSSWLTWGPALGPDSNITFTSPLCLSF